MMKKIIAIVKMSFLITISKKINKIILVTGYEKYRNDIRKWAEKKNRFIEVIHNSGYKKGMFSSIQKGLELVSSKCRGFFIHPGDCIGIKPSIIIKLINEFDLLKKK